MVRGLLLFFGVRMATQLNLFATAIYNDGVTALPPVGTPSGGFAATLTNLVFNGEKISVTTSAMALPLGSLGTAALAWLLAINLDPTTYITVLNATGGTGVAYLSPGGGPVLLQFPSNITAPFIQAHTAACLMQFLLAGP